MIFDIELLIKQIYEMLNSLAQTLSKTKKNKLFREAYLYSQVQNFAATELLKNYPDYQKELLELKIFCKEYKNNLEINLTAGDLTFLTWVKMEIPKIKEFLKVFLVQKNILTSDQDFNLKCSTK